MIINSCKKGIDKTKKTELIDKAQSELNNEQLLDTINGDNYYVLFFHPNETEFEELIKIYGEELNEVDSDFGFYTNKVYDSISKTDLKIKIVTERIIRLTTKKGIKYLDRLKNNKSQYGVIFNKQNCEPRIEFGVMTDIDFFQIMNEYKKNCK